MRQEALSALLTSRPHPEYNKTHTMSKQYHNWFIVYCGLKATDKASVVDFLGIDLLGDEVSGWLGTTSSAIEVGTSGNHDIIDTTDFEELFGEDASAIVEELKSWDENINSDNMGTLPKPCKKMKLANEPSVSCSFPLRLTLLTWSPERVSAAVLRNTLASMAWPLKNFNAIDFRQVPTPDLLASHDADVVCRWLCLYLIETRSEDGKVYPPGTIRNLVSGLNHILKAPFSVLDRHDLRFHELHNTLDTVSSNLHREGIGVTKESASVITADNEALFWAKGFSSPKLLQHTVFLYVGVNCVLRGLQDLKRRQLQRVPVDLSIYDSYL